MENTIPALLAADDWSNYRKIVVAEQYGHKKLILRGVPIASQGGAKKRCFAISYTSAT